MRILIASVIDKKVSLSKMEVRLVWVFFQSLLSLCCLRLPSRLLRQPSPTKRVRPLAQGELQRGRGWGEEVQGDWFERKARLD